MSDMAPDNWKEMICVETANAADDAIHLSPGDSQAVGVDPRSIGSFNLRNGSYKN